MEYKSGTEAYYRQMLELQDKLRKSEEERIKLEQKFNEIIQQSRDAEHERLRIMRHKYHKFLEEDKMRQERNENILRTLERVETRAKQLAAKTDRFKAFRKQYFENYLKHIPRQKQQPFELNTQSKQQPQYQHQHQYQQESVRRKLFTDNNQPPNTATTHDNVETKLALLEKYLRDNFDNFPQEFPTSKQTEQNGIPDGKQTNILYDNKNYLDDASDSKESQEIHDDQYPPSKILGNRIEQELDRLRNKNEKELNNNSLVAQEINPEQVISDYKKLVSKSEEKFGLKNTLQNGIPKEIAQIEANKLPINHIDDKENTSMKIDLMEEEDNSEDTKPPTDISLNLSSQSQFKEHFDESKQEQIETLPEIQKEENLDISSISEEITSIEKQKVPQTSTPEIANNENKFEQNVEYSDEPYIERVQANEFGESVSNQQYSEEQKYPPGEYQEIPKEEYTAPQGEIQEQYVEEQSEYKPDYESTTLQDNKEKVYDEQQYINSEEQLVKPEEQYANPEQQYENTKQYENTEYNNTEQFEAAEKPYPQSDEYANPEQMETPEQQYVNPEQYIPPEQQYVNPEQYEPAEQQYEPSEQQYVDPNQQYETTPQPYEPPEQQYVNPEEQYVNPEQQEYPPETYDQQYPQQTYPEGEYDPQNYPQGYDTQQPDNYDTQNYPQEQYPEGYDPQQYSEEQQIEYDQQYPQGEGYQEQQFAENTAEYDPQGQYPENVYQTGQEYLQGEQNVDLQYESEQQQNYPPEGYVPEEGPNETVTESEETSVISEQQKQLEDNVPLVQKQLPNLADMLDTDTSESVKLDNKVSDSDFDFSNTKT